MNINPSKKPKLKNLQHHLADDIRRFRYEKGISIEEAAEVSKIPIGELKNLELGYHKNWRLILRAAEFYEKKVKITFY